MHCIVMIRVERGVGNAHARVITISALAMMRLAISPMPIGLTPGHLSKAINLQARNGEIAHGSIKLEQRRFATSASD